MALLRFLLLAVGLLALGGGTPPLAYGQTIARNSGASATTPTAKRDTTTNKANKQAPANPVDALKQRAIADSRRLLQVAVVRVSKPIGPADSAIDCQTCALLVPGKGKEQPKAGKLHFQLNDEVQLRVRDLRLALLRYKRRAEDLRLYIGDIALPMPPEQVDTIFQRDTALVRFRLVRDATTETIWQKFYHVPGKYRHNAQFNIGFDSGQLGQPCNCAMDLLLVSRSLIWIGMLALAVLLGACWWLVRRSNFIRSDFSVFTPVDDTQQLLGLSPLYRKVPYSLAKSQVAFWTILTVGAYLLIALVTTALPVIPSGLLGLLGISVANGVFSRLIKQPAPETLPATKVMGNNRRQSGGWFYDVLTEDTGVSLARLQFVLFNAIAGFYLVYFVQAHWSLPDFDSGVLALISISAAGFLANQSQNTPDQGAKPSAGSTPGNVGGGGGAPGGPVAPAPAPVPAPGVLPDAPQPPVNPGPAPVGVPLPVVAPPPSPPAASVALQQWNDNLRQFLDSPIRYNSDPTRDIFGLRPAAADGCQLSVRIVSAFRGGLELEATVQAEPKISTTGNVTFLLHPTYPQRVLAVPLQNAEATLRFFSAGCFTLIAMLNAGQTVLAFDLRDVPGAPSTFLAN